MAQAFTSLGGLLISKVTPGQVDLWDHAVSSHRPVARIGVGRILTALVVSSQRESVSSRKDTLRMCEQGSQFLRLLPTPVAASLPQIFRNARLDHCVFPQHHCSKTSRAFPGLVKSNSAYVVLWFS